MVVIMSISTPTHASPICLAIPFGNSVCLEVDLGRRKNVNTVSMESEQDGSICIQGKLRGFE